MLKLASYMQTKKGQTLVEYGLLLALIAVVVIAILTTTGTNLKDIFTTVSGKLEATATT